MCDDDSIESETIIPFIICGKSKPNSSIELITRRGKLGVLCGKNGEFVFDLANLSEGYKGLRIFRIKGKKFKIKYQKYGANIQEVSLK